MLDKIDRANDAPINRGNIASGDAFVVLVESRPFLHDCIVRNMKSAFSGPVFSISALSELANLSLDDVTGLVLVSLIEADDETWEQALNELWRNHSQKRIVVLASTNNVERARAALRHGAKGFIPLTMGFDIAIQAMRLVMAGGTYAPIDQLVAKDQGVPLLINACDRDAALTTREIMVVRGIKEGKLNKVIAFELNMCESTVKVHVRNIMKKLHAKNRTEVAMKA